MTKEELKGRLEAAKVKATYKLYDAAAWMADNPELTAGLTALAGRALWELGRSRQRKIREERELCIYDPITGAHLHLKRRMNANEAARYSRMLELGLTRTEALDKLNLLK